MVSREVVVSHKILSHHFEKYLHAMELKLLGYVKISIFPSLFAKNPMTFWYLELFKWNFLMKVLQHEGYHSPVLHK